MDNEIWKSLSFVGYNDYSISSQGRIRNDISGRIWPGCKTGKYYGFGGKRDGRKYYLVHRLVAMAFIPNPYNKPQVDHINGNTHDNSINNLRWVTAKENTNNPICLQKFHDRIYTETTRNKMRIAKLGKKRGKYKHKRLSGDT